MDACLKTVLDTMPEAVVVCNRKVTITYANSAARLLYGYPGPQGLRLPDQARTPLSRSTLEGVTLEHVEVAILRSDRTSRTVLCSTAPLRRRSGKVTGAVGVFRDISSLKEAESERGRLLEENRRQRELLERLFEAVPLGIAVLEGPDYRHILVNALYRERIVARGKEVLGRTVAEVFSCRAASLVPALDEVRRTGEPYRIVDLPHQAATDPSPAGRRSFSYSFWPLPRPGDETGSLLALIQETTKEVRERDRVSAMASLVAKVCLGADLPEVLWTTLTKAVELLGGADGSLFLLEPRTTCLRGVAEIHPKHRVGAVVHLDDWPNGRRVAQSKNALFVTLPETKDTEPEWFRRLGIWGCIAAPLRVNERSLGLILIDFPQPGYVPPPEDLEFAAAIAEHCSLAIDRTQAHEERARLLELERVARAEAEAQAAQMRAILENLSEGVVVRDASGRLVMRNRRARDITGIPDESAAALSDIEGVGILGRDGRELRPDQWPIRRLLAGESLADEEITIERAGRGPRVVVVSGTPVRDQGGKDSLAVMTMHDITELRRLEHAKDEFLQVLAHELRNPLAAAFGLVQLASAKGESETSGRSGDYLRLAEVELRRLSDLVNDIIAGYRVASGRLPLDLRPIDFADVLTKTAQPYSLGLFQAQLEVLPPPSGAIPVVGDERRLAEVVQNLLSNAIKYSARGSSVVVETVLSDGNILVRVLDRGIGIPADQLEQVFAGFYRATNLTGRQPGGLGLGLYISRDIVRRHGGELWAENREGGGTAMCLRLPLAGAGAAACSAGDDAIPGVTGSEASN